MKGLINFFRSLDSNKSNATTEVQQPIYYSTQILEEKVKRWLDSEGTKPEGFESFLKQVGITLPVTISDWNGKDYTFKCQSESGNEWRIRLGYGDIDDLPSIRVTYGDVETYYEVINFDNASIELRHRRIKTEASELYTYIFQNAFSTQLTIKDYQLEIRMEIPYSSENDLRREHLTYIEAYVAALESIDVESIYTKVKKMIPDIVFKSGSLVVEYKRVKQITPYKTEETIISKRLLKEGKLLEYVETVPEFKAKIAVDISGTWCYMKEGMSVAYNSETNKIKVMVEREKDDFDSLNLGEEIRTIETRVKDYMNKLG